MVKNRHDAKYPKEKLEEYKQTLFPLYYKNNIYSLIEGSYFQYDEKQRCNKYYLCFSDQEGYKYCMSYSSIRMRINRGGNFNKFFYYNSYTTENINLFLKNNNSFLKLLTQTTNKSNAHECLEFWDDHLQTTKIHCWFNIHKEPYKYSWDYVNKMALRRDEKTWSKDKIKQYCIDLQNELQRPLIQGDFENVTKTGRKLGIRTIWRIFGTFSNMINELGLLTHDNYFKPNTDSFAVYNDYQNTIKKICEDALSSGRNIVSINDFIQHGVYINPIRERCKRDNLDLNELLWSHGCVLQKCGRGMNYVFEDGEKVESKYEYEFSLYLRDCGLKYNKDYYRSVKYSEIDSSIQANINCDYKLIRNGNDTYVEIAGFLGKRSEVECYYSNTPIKSSCGKEQYRLKLNQKREIFEKNNKHYYFLFPDDMNIENYKKIIERSI